MIHPPKMETRPKSYKTKDVGSYEDLVIAGWAGRNSEAIEKHIVELEELGVPRPQKTPTFYQVAANLASYDSVQQFVGDASSGEVEIVVVCNKNECYVTVGSDHTDRKLETVGVSLSKQICSKPMASVAWSYDDVKDHWDDLILRSWVHENGVDVLYQEGSASQNRTFENLQSLFSEEIINSDFGKRYKKGVAMFCGTLPVIGEIRSGSSFTMELEDPILKRSIKFSYEICTLPEMG